MLIRKQMLAVILVLAGVTLLGSETSVFIQEQDAIGTLPEMIVTAPRHTLHNTGWTGMLEEVIVTARRPSVSIAGTQSAGTYFNNSMYVAALLAFIFATLSLLSMSLYGYVTAKEKNHAGSRH